ncbi:MAG: hypothetical protein Aurels2KO_08690 [Aureliella sp.]
MTQSGSKSNDLLLRFRVEKPEPEQPPRQLGGWVMWCLLGVVMGVCGWWVSKQLLVDGLSQQLVESESRGDALVTLQRLSMLGDDAVEPLCRALLHQDERVAQSAYLMLDSRISQWQNDAVENEENFTQLAKLLDVIPDDTLPTRLALASSLATRLLVFCAGQTQQDFSQAIAHCESVVSRSTNAQFRQQDIDSGLTSGSIAANSNASGSNAVDVNVANVSVASPVPPPLQAQGDNGLGDSAAPFTKSLSDSDESRASNFADVPSLSNSGVPVYQMGNSNIESAQSTPMASIRMVPRRPISLSGGRRVSETAAKYSISADASRPAELAQQPAAAVLDAPMQQMVPAPQYDLASIPDLPIADLVRLLAVGQPKVAQTAALALKSKGMDDQRIELASRIAGELATGSRASKIKMAQDVVSLYDLDEPSPWLLWIAEDSDSQVRKTAIGLLHGQVDEGVGRHLRSMLGLESNPAVIQTLRQVLASNPGLPLR